MNPNPAALLENHDFSGVLDRMSAHLDRLAAQVFELEQAVASHLTQDEKAAEEAIREFQTLDFLRQSLEDLAILSLLIADPEAKLPPNPMHLATKLKLDSTKAIVLGGAGIGFDDGNSGSGELDLF